jgi:predicted hydrolase (HD superfamily)
MSEFTFWATQTVVGLVMTLAFMALGRVWSEIDTTRKHVHELRNKMAADTLTAVDRISGVVDRIAIMATKEDIRNIRQDFYARFDHLEKLIDTLIEREKLRK